MTRKANTNTKPVEKKVLSKEELRAKVEKDLGAKKASTAAKTSTKTSAKKTSATKTAPEKKPVEKELKVAKKPSAKKVSKRDKIFPLELDYDDDLTLVRVNDQLDDCESFEKFCKAHENQVYVAVHWPKSTLKDYEVAMPKEFRMLPPEKFVNDLDVLQVYFFQHRAEKKCNIHRAVCISYETQALSYIFDSEFKRTKDGFIDLYGAETDVYIVKE